MRYPIAIEPGTTETAFGVVVPDLPGCFSAGDTLDEALTGAAEAAAVWIDAALDAGETIPQPGSLEALRQNGNYEGWTFGVITLDPARLNALARATGATRSATIARLTLEKATRVGTTST